MAVKSFDQIHVPFGLRDNEHSESAAGEMCNCRGGVWIFLAHGDASQTFLHVIHDEIKGEVIEKEGQSYLSAMPEGAHKSVLRTIGAATPLYACPAFPNLRIETPREQLLISRSLETDKDVYQQCKHKRVVAVVHDLAVRNCLSSN